MAYKYSTGSLRQGDIYYEDDRLGEPTYIDFGMDTISLRPSGSAILNVSASAVGIGTTAPDYTLDVAGNIGLDEYLYHNGDDNTYIRFQNDDINMQVGGTSMIKLDKGNNVVKINNANQDIDFKIKDNNSDVLFHADAGDAQIGIGTDSPISKLDVAGKIAITAEVATPSAPADGKGWLYTKTDGKIYWQSADVAETDLTSGGGGGGGISFNGSTANGVVTYGNSSTADVEANLIFDGSKLSVTGDISGSGGLEAVGATVLGGALNVSGAVTLGTLTSGSAAGPSSFLAVDTSGIIKLDEPTVTAALPDKHVQGLTLTYIDDDQIQIGTGECRNIANDADMSLTSVQNVDITASGINGLDTGTVADATWYSIWLVSGTSGTGGLFSTSEDSPTLPAGYNTSKRRLGWIITYQTAIPVFAQTGGTRERTLYWGEAVGFSLLHAGVSDTTGWQTSYSMAAGTAPTAHTMLVTMQALAGGTNSINWRWQGFADMGAGYVISQLAQTILEFDTMVRVPCIDNSGANMEIRIKTWSTATANIKTAGWIETL